MGQSAATHRSPGFNLPFASNVEGQLRDIGTAGRIDETATVADQPPIFVEHVGHLQPEQRRRTADPGAIARTERQRRACGCEQPVRGIADARGNAFDGAVERPVRLPLRLPVEIQNAAPSDRTDRGGTMSSIASSQRLPHLRQAQRLGYRIGLSPNTAFSARGWRSSSLSFGSSSSGNAKRASKCPSSMRHSITSH
jgi:hypothetical protein